MANDPNIQGVLLDQLYQDSQGTEPFVWGTLWRYLAAVGYPIVYVGLYLYYDVYLYLSFLHYAAFTFVGMGMQISWFTSFCAEPNDENLSTIRSLKKYDNSTIVLI